MNTNALSEFMLAAGKLETELSQLRAENARLKGERSNRKKLSAREVDHIRRMAGRHSQRDIAAAFDVNPATVSRIVRGIYWK